MYESLAQFRNIVVSGPQRSGTRFAAKCIAHDTDKTYIDEKDIAFHDFRLLEYYLNKGNCVIQCPGLCHMLHYITDQTTLVILMVRDIDEIMMSQNRINWGTESRLQELYKYGCSEGVIARIKYAFWNVHQKQILGDRGRTIDYDFLKQHPLFVEKRTRGTFTWDQTKKSEE